MTRRGVLNVALKSTILDGMSNCRGEEGDSLCLACLAESKTEEISGNNGGEGTEMIQNGL